MNILSEILFPRNINCIFCGSPISRENYLSTCKSCYQKMDFISEICIRCGRFGKGAGICIACSDEKYHFDTVYSALAYNDFMHHGIYSYKYGHKSYMGKYFGAILKEFVLENELQYDFITAVPISAERMKMRGFNQSKLIAESIDANSYIDLFVRKKKTDFLSGFSRGRRIVELEDAFAIDDEVLERMISDFYEREDAADKKIKLLIVDDIITTGSTLSELSKLAKKQILNIEITALTLCSARK